MDSSRTRTEAEILQEIENLKRELQRIQEEKKRLLVIESVNEREWSFVVTSLPETCASIIGRQIQILSFEELHRILESSPEVEWKSDEAQLAYLRGCSFPVMNIYKEDNWVVCDPGPKGLKIANHLAFIPGTRREHGKATIKIPYEESWRILDEIKGVDGVVIEESLQESLLDDMNRRILFDKIAVQEDASPEFLEKLQTLLTREVWNERTRSHVPFWSFLLPFQRVAIEFAYKNAGRLFIGDDTGLGKTVEALAYSELLRAENSAETVLVIAKAANLPNWMREIRRFTGDDPVHCVTSTPSGDALYRIATKAPYMVISYDTIGSKIYTERNRPDVKMVGESHPEWDKGYYAWTQLFLSFTPDILILDEVHQMKNSSTHRWKSIKPLSVCKRILPLSATPILNRIGELWTPLHMVAPEVFYSEDRFLSRYTYSGRIPKDVDKLHQLIRPVFLRRRKNEVLKDLPPINRIIQYYTLSERAQVLYNRVLQGIYEELKEYDPSGIGGQSSRVFNLLSQFTRLKKICAADKREHTVALASELERLGNGKVLIFSQFKGSAYAIHRELGSESVCTVERSNRQFISMDAKQRDELFEDVRHDPRIRYIVTTNASEEGHNLEFCDYVIFNDLFWTPKSHMQCEGRAYGRLSNPHPIDSYYIITETLNGEKSIEHIIINILSEKMRTFEEVVEGVEASREKDISVAMELIRILKEGL